MNLYCDLKKNVRENLNNHIKQFKGQIKTIPIGVSGEIPEYKKDATEEKKKIQQHERSAKKKAIKNKKHPKSETMKKVLGHSRGNDGYLLFLECGHQKQSAVKETSKIPLTSKCFECIKEKESNKCK